MIRVTSGNIVQADAEALVNTVNCVGFMGKGIALQFKKAFPANFKAYQRACRVGDVCSGRMFVYETESFTNPKYIINFPTKCHWKGNSRLENIETGLAALTEVLRERGIRSVAIPPLGCGLGGLDWRIVRPMIVQALESLPDTEVLLFEPAGTPEPRRMPVGTARPRMTLARALMLLLMQRYSELEYKLTLLEIQKLGYFLQESGEPMRLRYEAALYGPYAHNLNKLLEVMEGHYTRGYGDTQKPDVEIDLLPGAVEQASSYLQGDVEHCTRLERVARLIEGFETPHGMELLSSVHWVATHGDPPVVTAEEAVRSVHDWNERKRGMFPADHIRVAWARLQEQGWVVGTSGN